MPVAARLVRASALLLISLPAVLLAARAAAPAPAPPAPFSHAGHDGLPPALAKVLDDIRARDDGQLAVSVEDGRFLRLLVGATGARRALEIGGASGYSTIWIGLGLREAGGRLTSIEYDPQRARELAANVSRAGLSDVVTVLAGDAFQQIPTLAGTFDFVFLDAWKRDYRKFFDLVAPRLDAGGLLLAHNVVNKRGELQDFLDAIDRAPGLWNATVSPSGEGISLSYRKRR